MGITGVIVAALLLERLLSSNSDAVIAIQKFEGNGNCIEGDMVFARNTPITMIVGMRSESGFSRQTALLSIDIEWGVHNQQTVPMIRSLFNQMHAELYIYLNHGRRVFPHQSYHFRFCGFAEVARNQHIQLGLTSKNAEIFFV